MQKHISILQYLENIDKDKAVMVTKFKEYITYKDIPLNSRWNIFVKSPQFLKNHDTCVPALDNLYEDFIMYDGPLHMDRHGEADAQDIYDAAINSNSRIQSGDFKHGKSLIDIDLLREEILQMNLGSFEYDW